MLSSFNAAKPPPLVFASEVADTPVTITADATTFSVTVPTTLPIHVDADGVVQVGELVVVNSSTAPVKITDVEVAPLDPWRLVDFSEDFSAKPVGSKDIAIQADVPASGVMTIPVSAKVAPQSTPLTNEMVAYVFITIGWDAVSIERSGITTDYSLKNIDGTLIGKSHLIVQVPVRDERLLRYSFCTLDGCRYDGTAVVKGGVARIEVTGDFHGDILLKENDGASVSVAEALGGSCILIEDDAPIISFNAADELTVTVKDNINNAISSGLASVTYRVETGEEHACPDSATFVGNVSVYETSFAIPQDLIPSGTCVIRVTAVDPAGNISEYQYTYVKTHVCSLTYIDAYMKEPCCESPGARAYYLCRECRKRFLDASGVNEVLDDSALVIPPLGHDYVLQWDTVNHYNECSRCSLWSGVEKHKLVGGMCAECGYST